MDRHLSKVSIYTFLHLKNMKKGYMELTEKIYLDTFEKCPGSVHFSLLCSHRFTNSSQPQKVSKGRM